MSVVSDATPLIYLSAASVLDILPRLYGKVYIPPAVYEEVVSRGTGRQGSTEVKSADWIEVSAPANKSFISSLAGNLGSGEAEAIALTRELSADLLLIDDKQGRAMAAVYGLTVRGVAGILAEAKYAGLIESVKYVFDFLLAHTKYRMGDALYREALRDVGEF